MQSLSSLPTSRFHKRKQMFDALTTGVCNRDESSNKKQPQAQQEKQASRNEQEEDRSKQNADQMNKNPNPQASFSIISSLNENEPATRQPRRHLNADQIEIIVHNNFDRSSEESGDEVTNNETTLITYPRQSFMDLPYTDDEKSHMRSEKSHENETQIKIDFANQMNILFEGLSQETYTLLDSLFVNNKQVAEFFEEPLAERCAQDEQQSTLLNDYSSLSSLTNISQINYVNDKTSSSNAESTSTPKSECKTSHLTNIPNYLALSSSSSVLNSSPDSSQMSILPSSNLMSELRNEHEINLNNVTTTTNHSNDESFSYHETEEMLNSIYEINNKTNSTIVSSCNCDSKYIDLDNVYFTYDDMYSQNDVLNDSSCLFTENESLNSKNTSESSADVLSFGVQTSQAQPPPKPKRTFEHDLYLRKLNPELFALKKKHELALNKNKWANSTSNIYEQLKSNRIENIYETIQLSPNGFDLFKKLDNASLSPDNRKTVSLSR